MAYLCQFFPSHASSYNRTVQLCVLMLSGQWCFEFKVILWVALVSSCSAGPGLYHPEVRVFGPLPASRIVLDKVWHSIVVISSASMAKCWQSPFPIPQRVWPIIFNGALLMPHPYLPHHIHHFILLLHLTSAVAVSARPVVQFTFKIYLFGIEKLCIHNANCLRGFIWHMEQLDFVLRV